MDFHQIFGCNIMWQCITRRLTFGADQSWGGGTTRTHYTLTEQRRCNLLYRGYAESCFPARDGKNLMDYLKNTDVDRISPGAANDQSESDRQVNVLVRERERG